MRPATLLLVRHGRALGAGRFCGRTDMALSPDGVLEARRAGRALASVARRVPIDALYASPLARAHGTAAVIGKAIGRPVRIRGDLVERHFGEWEGRSPGDLPAADLARLWECPRFSPPGGESVVALTRRASRSINRLVARHIGDTVVVVAHGGLVRALLGHWLGLDVPGMLRLDIDTGRAVLLQGFADGGVRIAGINLPPAAWADAWRPLIPDQDTLRGPV